MEGAAREDDGGSPAGAALRDAPPAVDGGEPETDWEALIAVGRIARPHGNAGRVVVNPDTDFAADRFRVGRAVCVRRGGRVERLVIRDVRFHRGRPIVGFDGVRTIPEAAELANAEVRVPAAALAALPADTFYYHELIGCRVETVGGRAVGAVVAVEGGGEAHRLVVEDASAEVQVPLTASICVRIDPRARLITLDPPQGLLDLNRRPRDRARPRAGGGC